MYSGNKNTNNAFFIKRYIATKSHLVKKETFKLLTTGEL